MHEQSASCSRCFALASVCALAALGCVLRKCVDGALLLRVPAAGLRGVECTG